MKRLINFCMIFILSFSIQLFAANNAPYREPEFHLDNAPTAMAIEKTYTIGYTITVPGEPDITGIFDVTPSSAGEEITTVGNPDKITVQYNYHFSNGGWHYETKVFDLKVTSAVYDLDKIIYTGKNLGLINQTTADFVAVTTPPGYESNVEWNVSGPGTANGSGRTFSFTPLSYGPYTIQAKTPNGSYDIKIYTAVEASFSITKTASSTTTGHAAYPVQNSSVSIDFGDNIKYLITTTPQNVVTNVIGSGSSERRFYGAVELSAWYIPALITLSTSEASYTASQTISGSEILTLTENSSHTKPGTFLGGSDNHTFNFAGAVPLNPHQTPDVELSIITTASLSANAVSRWAEVDLDYTVEPLTSNFNISGVE